MKEVKWIRWNVLELAIPLQKVTVTPEGTTMKDYNVPTGATVTVKLKVRYNSYNLPAVVNGDMLHVEDKGEMSSGRYAVEILIKEMGRTRRCLQWPDVLRLYEDNAAMFNKFVDYMTLLLVFCVMGFAITEPYGLCDHVMRRTRRFLFEYLIV